MSMILNPVNLLVLSIFLGFLGLFIWKATYIHKNLNSLIVLFKSFSKNDLIYRFNELNEVLLQNPYIADYWSEFKDTLLFSDKIIYKSEQDEFCFDSATEESSHVYSTADSNYFFNEETLIYRKLNYKLISSIPALLTGLGPLGTFTFIAIGFSKINFSSEENTLSSISALLSNMQVAALISIAAIGSALSFIIIERSLYSFLCKRPLHQLQIEINRLFGKVTIEKFLIELIKESKRQNNALNIYSKALPEDLRTSFDGCLNSRLIPYLENIVYILNQQKEIFSKDIINKLLD